MGESSPILALKSPKINIPASGYFILRSITMSLRFSKKLVLWYFDLCGCLYIKIMINSIFGSVTRIHNALCRLMFISRNVNSFVSLHNTTIPPGCLPLVPILFRYLFIVIYPLKLILSPSFPHVSTNPTIVNFSRNLRKLL